LARIASKPKWPNCVQTSNAYDRLSVVMRRKIQPACRSLRLPRIH
jgi:hypothetical protein